MSEIKTSALLTDIVLTSTDSFVFVDPNDTTQGPSGSTKKAALSSVSTFVWGSSANYGVDKINPLFTAVSPNSANWNNTKTTVQSNSAGWQGKANYTETIQFNSAFGNTGALQTLGTTNLNTSATMLAYDAPGTQALTTNVRLYKLVGSTAATQGEYIIRPNDYNSVSNQKVWAWANPIYRYESAYTIFLAGWGTDNGVIGDPSRPFKDFSAFPYGFTNYITPSRIEILDGNTYQWTINKNPVGSNTYLDVFVTGHPGAILDIVSIDGAISKIRSDKSVTIHWNAINIQAALSPVELLNCRIGSVTQYYTTTKVIDCIIEGVGVDAYQYVVGGGGSGSGSGSGTIVWPGNITLLNSVFTNGSTQSLAVESGGGGAIYAANSIIPYAGNISGTQHLNNCINANLVGY